MTPDEIHQLGLREIERIEAEMLVIAKKEGFPGRSLFPRIAEDQSEIYSDVLRADPR